MTGEVVTPGGRHELDLASTIQPVGLPDRRGSLGIGLFTGKVPGCTIKRRDQVVLEEKGLRGDFSGD